MDNVLALVDHLRAEGPRFIPPPTPEPVLGGGVSVEPDENGMDRVWFWCKYLSRVWGLVRELTADCSVSSHQSHRSRPRRSATISPRWHPCGS